MQACTQWTHSDVWSQLATTPECLFKIEDRDSKKKRRNSDRRVIWNVMHGIHAGRVLIRHRGVSDSSDGARPLWRSHSARTEMFFADGIQSLGMILDVCLDRIFICIVELRRLAALASYVLCVTKFFAIYQNMRPAQSGNTCWQWGTLQS